MYLFHYLYDVFCVHVFDIVTNTFSMYNNIDGMNNVSIYLSIHFCSMSHEGGEEPSQLMLYNSLGKVDV